MRAYLLKLRLVGQSGGYARLNSPGSWDGTLGATVDREQA